MVRFAVRGNLGVSGFRPAPTKIGRLTPVWLPVQSHVFFESRGGVLAKTVQLIEPPAGARAVRTGRATHRMADGRPGELVLGLVSAMDEVFALSRRNYRPLREELALDFGLSVMFATPQGDLLGRRWFDQLRKHDRRINGLARGLQRQGIGPARSPDATVPGSRPSGAFSPPRSAAC